jgi:CRP/FNR family transcriptional regulator, nitrogen oxide reductase regulator
MSWFPSPLSDSVFLGFRRQNLDAALGDSSLGSNCSLPLISPLFRNLDRHAIHAITQSARRRAFAGGEFLCRLGEPATHLYLLVAGVVKIIGYSRAGNEVLFDWLHTGDVFGLEAVLSSPMPYAWTALATEDVQVLEWGGQLSRSFASKWNSFNENVLGIALGWAHEFQTRFQEMATGAAEQRIAGLILHLAGRTKISSDDGRELRISEEEMAQMAGTNMFTVNRIIARWRREGYVEKGRKRLLIRDPDSLLRISLEAD